MSVGHFSPVDKRAELQGTVKSEPLFDLIIGCTKSWAGEILPGFEGISLWHVACCRDVTKNQ